jgi:hypothetical protein
MTSGTHYRTAIRAWYRGRFGDIAILLVRLGIILPLVTLAVFGALGAWPATDRTFRNFCLYLAGAMWLTNGLVPCPSCLRPFCRKSHGWYETANPFTLKCGNCGARLFGDRGSQ